MKRLKSAPLEPIILEKTEQERISIEKMQDVLLLLDGLTQREEATVTKILDCLYDVGSLNLINNKFRSRSLKGMMKVMAKLSKPAFRIVALRWFKKNCPKLITDWLYDQVSF